ncbi:MAG TPA: DUF3943 domain-containing protein [Terriglobia bacterium]|nr:DUF3943 domain-containing protein [Terriglobia bacterium]
MRLAPNAVNSRRKTCMSFSCPEKEAALRFGSTNCSCLDWMRAISVLFFLLAAGECIAQNTGADATGAGFPASVEDSRPDSPSERDEPRKSYIIPAIEIVGFDFALNRFNNRFIDPHSFDISWSSIRRNLKTGWVVDNDEFETNQFLHPYQGSVYHTAARSSGLNFWTSAAYTFAGSALWEIAGETTPPSKNDQVASGIGGVFFGEPLFRMASLTLERGNGLPTFWRGLGATLISPATGFNRLVFGGRFDPIFPGYEPEFFTQWNFGATVAEHRVEGTSTRVRRNEGIAEFSMSYGLPGKRDYEYRRPFDYFNFEFTASSSNIFESIMTRGLIVGDDYKAGDSYHGVWGLYGTYDYMAPQVFRASSTAVALGTTGQWRTAGPVTFQGSALGGVGYGAAGTVEGVVGDRDYHYGITPQALLATRWIFGTVASLDVSGRGYQITRFASTNQRGWENILRGDASLTVRVFGPHSFTIKYLVTRRDAHYPDLGKRQQRLGTVALTYTLVGDRNFGAVKPGNK